MWMTIQQPNREVPERYVHKPDLLQEELASLREGLLREFRQMMAEQMRDIRLLVAGINNKDEPAIQPPTTSWMTSSHDVYDAQDQSDLLSESDIPQFDIHVEYEGFTWSQVAWDSIENSQEHEEFDDSCMEVAWENMEPRTPRRLTKVLEQGILTPEKLAKPRLAGPWTVFQDSDDHKVHVGADKAENKQIASLQKMPIMLLAHIRQFDEVNDVRRAFDMTDSAMLQASIASKVLDGWFTSCCGVLQPRLGGSNWGELPLYTRVFQGTDRGHTDTENVLQEFWHNWHEDKNFDPSSRLAVRCEYV
ncbi:unnamed protein product [Symbiodinium sp. CCMP2592]|nr:unnamed protein product [Symbiodinium sp. CCMP2592]